MISAILLTVAKYQEIPISPFIKLLVILIPVAMLILGGSYWLWTSLRRPPES